MMIDDKTRKKLLDILRGSEYRKIVSARARCHPNTVGLLLRKKPKVITEKTERVELELLVYAKEVLEQKDSANRLKKARAITKQLYTLAKA